MWVRLWNRRWENGLEICTIVIGLYVAVMKNLESERMNMVMTNGDRVEGVLNRFIYNELMIELRI